MPRAETLGMTHLPRNAGIERTLFTPAIIEGDRTYPHPSRRPRTPVPMVIEDLRSMPVFLVPLLSEVGQSLNPMDNAVW